MKDYRVEIKVKNNLLYRAMLDNGIETGAELARLSGCRLSLCYHALTLRLSLYTQSGEVRKSWIQISECLKRLPEDLVPKQHWYEKLEKNTGSFEASLSDLSYLTGPKAPDQLVFNSEKKNIIQDILKTLTPREQKILELRFGLNGHEPMTLREIGKIQNVTSVRIRSLELKALSKLRRPIRSSRLKPLLEGEQ